MDRWFDRRVGTRASGLVTTESLGIDAPGNHDYVATSFLTMGAIAAVLTAAGACGFPQRGIS